MKVGADPSGGRGPGGRAHLGRLSWKCIVGTMLRCRYSRDPEPELRGRHRGPGPTAGPRGQARSSSRQATIVPRGCGGEKAEDGSSRGQSQGCHPQVPGALRQGLPSCSGSSPQPLPAPGPAHESDGPRERRPTRGPAHRRPATGARIAARVQPTAGRVAPQPPQSARLPAGLPSAPRAMENGAPKPLPSPVFRAM